MRRWVFAAAMFAGCGEGLDVYSKIEDLRVIGIKADPPELFFDDPTRPTITFSALVLDPDEDSVSYEWNLCPVESSYGCSDVEKKLDLARSYYSNGQQLRDLRENLALSGTAGP